MELKVLTAVVAAAVQALCIIAAVSVFTADKPGQVTFSDTNRLLVYGNANNDNYLDDADLELTREIQSSGQWDGQKYPYADANTDGTVDSRDVDLVQKFLNGEDQRMYYTDWNLEISHIEFPIKTDGRRIAVPYDSSLWITQIAGIYDDVCYMVSNQDYIDNLREDMFPGAADRLIPQGTNGEYDAERIVQNGINLVLGDPKHITASYLDKISSQTQVQNILLPHNRVVNGLTWQNSVITLGVMTCNQEHTRDYIGFIEDVENKVKDATEQYEKDLTRSFLLVYQDTVGTPGVNVDIDALGSVQFGDVKNLEKLPLRCAMKPVGDSGFVETSVENIISSDPDVIIFTVWGPFQNDISMDEYKRLLRDWCEPYKHSRAYQEGHVYAVSFELYGTLPGSSGLIYLASMLWDGVFDRDVGYQLLKDYFDKFTLLSDEEIEHLDQMAGLLPLRASEWEAEA